MAYHVLKQSWGVQGLVEAVSGRSAAAKVGLAAGPVIFAIVAVLPVGGLPVEARVVLGLALWMASWWVTEAIPIYATALLPLAVLPATGAVQILDVVAPYADPIVFLFLGGLLLAKAVEKSNAHRRFALAIVRMFGTRPKYIVAGFMAVTGLLSAWMSNTATAMLMVPIAAAVMGLVADEKRRASLGLCLMLGVAYSASLGGMATLVGTPPNAVFASLAKSLAGVDVSFAQWMVIAAPLSALSIFLAWLYLVHVGARPGVAPVAESKAAISKMLADLGRMAGDEKAVVAVFAGTAVAWVTRGIFWADLLPLVNDSVIAISAAVLLFVIPARSKGAKDRKPLLDWHTAAKIPWGVLVLMGGGLSLAAAFSATGLDVWIAGNLSFLEGLNYFVIILAVALVTVFISEIISNTATVALLIPVAAALAGALSIDPILLMLPVALVNTYGFMMPVGTPPNAIVFASGYVTARKMARTGIVLDIMGVVLVSTFAAVLLPLVW